MLRWAWQRAEERPYKRYDWLPTCHRPADIVKALWKGLYDVWRSTGLPPSQIHSSHSQTGRSSVSCSLRLYKSVTETQTHCGCDNNIRGLQWHSSPNKITCLNCQKTAAFCGWNALYEECVDVCVCVCTWQIQQWRRSREGWILVGNTRVWCINYYL